MVFIRFLIYFFLIKTLNLIEIRSVSYAVYHTLLILDDRTIEKIEKADSDQLNVSQYQQTGNYTLLGSVDGLFNIHQSSINNLLKLSRAPHPKGRFIYFPRY